MQHNRSGGRKRLPQTNCTLLIESLTISHLSILATVIITIDSQSWRITNVMSHSMCETWHGLQMHVVSMHSMYYAIELALYCVISHNNDWIVGILWSIETCCLFVQMNCSFNFFEQFSPVNNTSNINCDNDRRETLTTTTTAKTRCKNHNNRNSSLMYSNCSVYSEELLQLLYSSLNVAFPRISKVICTEFLYGWPVVA